MTLREGSGMVSPAPVTVELTPPELRWLKEVAVARERRRGYQLSYTTWKQGIISLPTFVGLVGEHALCLFLNRRLRLSLSVNADDMPGGDGDVDLLVHRVALQVKTRTCRRDVLVRRCTDDGRLLPLNWHACVSATWERRPDEEPLTVFLDGWVRKSALLEQGHYALGRAGPWRNLELADVQLESMNDLVASLRVNRDLQRLR